MSALCILAAGKTTVIAASMFSLSWTHSVQKTEWQEDWRIEQKGLLLTEARVKGSGAGMEPPEGSQLIGGWWVYQPPLPAQKTLVLASSGATGSGWKLCASGHCMELGENVGETIILNSCQTD